MDGHRDGSASGPGGRLILVLGGARSGKSSFAQEYAARLEREEKAAVVFVATARAGDEEMRRRIEAHRQNRPRGWKTVEEPLQVSRAIDEHCAGGTVAIVDCLTLLLSNIIHEKTELDREALQNEVEKEISGIVRAVRNRRATVLIVSNEVGMGVVPSSPLGRFFRDVAGRANISLAREADEVHFLVAGIPQKLK